MTIETHSLNNIKIAEVIAEGIVIHTAEDGLELLGNLYYQGFDKLLLHEKNLNANFFDLKTGIAGEILQKFSNYRMGLAIVGDFSKYTGKAIRDFMFESNKTGHVYFVTSSSEALVKLSKT